MTERVDRGEPRAEILDLEHYSGLYGRLFLASLDRNSEITTIIDPQQRLNFDPDKINFGADRTYNPITDKLSREERTTAWQGMSFNEAYGKWRTGFTESIRSTTEQSQLDVLSLVFPNKTAQGLLKKMQMHCTNRFVIK